MQFRKMEFHVEGNPELSKVVQKKLFSLGYKWYDGVEGVCCLDANYIHADTDGKMTHCRTPCGSMGYIPQDLAFFHSKPPGYHININECEYTVSQEDYQIIIDILKK